MTFRRRWVHPSRVRKGAPATGTLGIMTVVLILLFIAAIAAGSAGLFVKGLLWLFFIGLAALLVSLVWGALWTHRRRVRRSA